MDHKLILAYLLALITISGGPGVIEAKLVLYDGEGRIFSIEVSEDKKNDNLPSILSFRCMKGCKNKVAIQEVFVDEPLGIFQYGGEENIVYVTSSSGSAYQIRAYKFGELGIQRVLSESASAVPRLISFEGKEAVEVFLRDYSASGFQYDRKVFVWDQKKFVEVR